MLIWGAWTQMHHSSLALRRSLLAEHAQTKTKRWLYKLQSACAISRQQKIALRRLAGTRLGSKAITTPLRCCSASAEAGACLLTRCSLPMLVWHAC